MKAQPRRLITPDCRSRSTRRVRLQTSLHLMLAAATVGGCAAPHAPPMPSRAKTPRLTSAEPRSLLDTAASAERPTDQETPSQPNPLLDAQGVPASHVVQATELVFDQAPLDIPPPGDAEAADADGRDQAESMSARAAGQTASAPQPVEYFVAQALRSHPRIAAARLRVAAASQRIPQAGALPDPMLNNVVWPISDNAAQTAAGRMTYELMLSQNVPWPQKLDALAAIAQREVEIARAEAESAEREIAEAVRLAYYELWYATESIEIVEDNRELVTDLITLAETRYRTGGAQQDVLRAELEGDRLEDELVQLRRQREVAQADLGALLQQPLELAPEPVRELHLPDDAGQLDQLIDAALACNPELRELAWQIARDRERERLAYLQRYPDLQFGFGWGAMTTDDALSPVADGRDNLNLSLGVSLPIWREKINAGIREAAANRAATSRLREAEEDVIYGNIRRLLAEAEGLYQQIELYRTRIIPRTERTLQLATADYRGERADFFSLIDIYQELLVYQVQIARMEASLAGTLARLDRAVGCPTDFIAASH